MTEGGPPRAQAALRAALWAAGGLATLIFVVVWAVVLDNSIPSPLSPGDGAALADFAGFWASGEAASRGEAALAWTWPEMQALIEAETGRALDRAMPWHYPPPMQLLSEPVSLVSAEAGRVLWPLAQLALLGCVAWRILPHPLAVILTLASPPALISTYAGQVGCLTAALTGLALIEYDRRPAGAGAALGLLAVKPHVALGPPLLALFEARWRLIVFAAATTAALCVVSVAIHGWATWEAFFASLRNTGASLGDKPEAARFDVYITVYGQLRDAGAGAAAAWAPQIVVALAALALAVRLWRRAAGDERLATAACLTAALSPRLFAYDLGFLAVAGLFLLRGAPRPADVAAASALYAASYLALVGRQDAVTAAALAFTFYLVIRPATAPRA